MYKHISKQDNPELESPLSRLQLKNCWYILVNFLTFDDYKIIREAILEIRVELASQNS